MLRSNASSHAFAPVVAPVAPPAAAATPRQGDAWYRDVLGRRRSVRVATAQGRTADLPWNRTPAISPEASPEPAPEPLRILLMTRLPHELWLGVRQHCPFGREIAERDASGRQQFVLNARADYGAPDLGLAALDARSILAYDDAARTRLDTTNVSAEELQLAQVVRMADRISLGPASESTCGAWFETLRELIRTIDPRRIATCDGQAFLFIPPRRDGMVPGSFGRPVNVVRTADGLALAPDAIRGPATDEEPGDVFRALDSQSFHSLALHVAIHKLKSEWPAAEDPVGMVVALLFDARGARPVDRPGLLAHLYQAAAAIPSGVEHDPMQPVLDDVVEVAAAIGAVVPDRCIDMLSLVLDATLPDAEHPTRYDAVVAVLDAMRALPAPVPLTEARPHQHLMRLRVLDGLSQAIQPRRTDAPRCDWRAVVDRLRVQYLALLPGVAVRPETATQAHPLVMAIATVFTTMQPDVVGAAVSDLLTLALRETQRTARSVDLLMWVCRESGMSDAALGRRLITALRASLDEPTLTDNVVESFIHEVLDRDEPYWRNLVPLEVDAARLALRQRARPALIAAAAELGLLI